jgi:hypothetical protein
MTAYAVATDGDAPEGALVVLRWCSDDGATGKRSTLGVCCGVVVLKGETKGKPGGGPTTRSFLLSTGTCVAWRGRGSEAPIPRGRSALPFFGKSSNLKIFKIWKMKIENRKTKDRKKKENQEEINRKPGNRTGRI